MLGWKCFPEGEKGGELGVKEWKQREKEIHKKKKGFANTGCVGRKCVLCLLNKKPGYKAVAAARIVCDVWIVFDIKTTATARRC